MWGIPTIDLFTTRDNRKCCLLLGVGGVCLSLGSLSDIFHLSQQSALLYAFPPILIIIQVILKLRADHGKLIQISLAWPRQCWFSDLLMLPIQPLWYPFLSIPTYSQRSMVTPCIPRSALCISQCGCFMVEWGGRVLFSGLLNRTKPSTRMA